MCDDERIEPCATCGDEACFCPNYYCKTCDKSFEAHPTIEVINGETKFYVHCPICKQQNWIRIDDGFDVEEYKKGER